MSKNAELTTETVVACPYCHQQNRLSKQTASGTYKCGNCDNPLPDPFAASPSSPSTGRKLLAWIVGLVVIFGISFSVQLFINFIKGVNEKTASTPSQVRPMSSGDSLPKLSDGTEIQIPTSPLPSLPAPSPSVALQNRSLPASKVLVPPSPSGDGRLKLSNGTTRDTYVKLVNSASRKLVAALYVKANSDFELEQIPDGTYEVLFVSGEDWDAKTKSFTRSKSFTKFDKSAKFVTTERADGIQYTIIEVTLNPVVGGNATLSGVDEQEFSQY